MRGAAVLLALAGVALWGLALDEPFVITLATKVAILGLAGVGLNLALGLGGMVSFGHAAFFGIGGYAAGILASHAGNYEPVITWPWAIEGSTRMLVIWPVAMAAAGLAALAIGALSLRTTGVFFIMITLAFAQMVYYFAQSWPAYGGEDGLSFYTRNGFPGLNTFDPIQFFGLAFAALMAGMGVMAVVRASRFGLALRGARQNPQRLMAAGIRPYPVRLVAFVLSAMLTGLAGALYADLNRFVSPAMMSWQMSGEIMVLVILGGAARLAGPVAGAALFVAMEEILGGISDHWQVGLGLVLLLVVLLLPGGLLGMRRRHG